MFVSSDNAEQAHILKITLSSVFLVCFKVKRQTERYLPMPLGCESVDEALSSVVAVTLLVNEYHGQAEYTGAGPR